MMHTRLLCSVVQVDLPQEVASQALSAKKQSKKQRIKEQGNGSSKAYYDVYGQQVSLKMSWTCWHCTLLQFA